MGPVILTALCLWSCILIVTPLDENELGSITNYIYGNFFRGETGQYAYFVKFVNGECRKVLQTQELAKALKNDKDNFNLTRIMRDKEIYVGERMAAASYTKQGTINIHSEYRLLNPNPVTKISPIQQLLQKGKPAACVAFFSLNSPCVKTCTDPKGRYNIMDMLAKLTLPAYGERAFAYNKVFRYDQEKDDRIVWEHWSELNKQMPLYRCTGNNCLKCWIGGVKQDKCLKG